MNTKTRRKICVATGTRAEYGLLSLLLNEIRNDSRLELQLIATGMHLSPEFGFTYKEIEDDGFTIDRKLEILLSSDSSSGVSKAIGLGTIGFADAFNSLNPDILVILGDRFEMISAATAALMSRIPIAHIWGGDITEGAIDDCIRHSLTKMSNIHFVTNEESAKRVRQLGEDPKKIFNYGSPGLDYIAKMNIMDKEKLSRELGFSFKKRNLLVTYHPETMASEKITHLFQEVLNGLSYFNEDVGIIFTKSNADTAGRSINLMIDNFVAERPNAKAYTSLGHRLYLSLMPHVDCVVGNSSSGLYEAPSLKKPTVNIGDRQKGRTLAKSVISCRTNGIDIKNSIETAFSLDCSMVVNPFGGDGHTSRRIKDVLLEVELAGLFPKRFFDFSI